MLAPGSTIGIIGGGQLARMTALEARKMNYRIAVLDPDAAGPAGQVADLHIAGGLDEPDAARELAHHSDIVTVDTEHVDAALLVELERLTRVRPSSRVMATVQDRLSQRRFLDREGLDQVRYAPVDDLPGLEQAVGAVGLPAVLKTRREGYDGKGQARITRHDELERAWQTIGRQPAVLESFVEFEREISVLLARGPDGSMRFHPVAENRHRHHILHLTLVPAAIDASLAEQAKRIGARIADALDHVGMLAVELFVTADNGLLVNEIAPRTHNSGHYSFGACVTSQFEQHVRAICGLPLGDTTLLRPAAMLNLLGDLWREGEPDFSYVLSQPTAKLHLYGKRCARPGRKMGHILLLEDSVEGIEALAASVYATLERPPRTG